MTEVYNKNPGPLCIVNPYIESTYQVDDIISINLGNWIWVSALLFTYQWRRDGVAISGEVSDTYQITESDRGKLITCFVTTTFSNNSTSTITNEAQIITPIYVSFSGNGSNDGLTSSTPIDLTTFLGLTLSPRSWIYFNKSETFVFGDYSILVNYCKISSYGIGADPLFSGSIDISTEPWTDEGSGLYSTPITQPKWIFKDGVASKLAQTTWMSPVSLPASNKIRGNTGTLNAYTNLVGAKLRIIQDYYLMGSEEYTVMAYNSGTGDITLNTNHPGAMLKFALLNYSEFVTGNNEWFYASSKLYYKSASNPSGLNIRSCIKDMAFDVTGITGTSFDNVTFNQYYYTSINATTGGTLTTIDNCRITDIKGPAIKFGAGVVTIEAHGSSIINCDIYRCGIGPNISGNLLTISNNYIYGMGMDLNYPFPSSLWRSSGTGMGIVGDYCDIRYNEINNTAYNGITISGINNYIYRNKIDTILQRFSDGGGIYTSGNSLTPTISTNYLGVFEENLISGIADVTIDGVVGSIPNSGLYLDNRSFSFTLKNNTVKGGSRGMYFNWNSSNFTIIDNTVYGSLNAVYFQQDTNIAASPLYPLLKRNVLTGNICLSKISTARSIYVKSLNSDANFNPFTDGGNSDYNYYIQPYGTNLATHEGSSAVNYTMSGWRTKLGNDANTVGRTNFLTYVDAPTADAQCKIYVNDTTSPVMVDLTGYKDKDGNSLGMTSVSEYSSVIYTL